MSAGFDRPRALVIGGTGFISFHCVEALLAAEYHVTILTRGKTKDPFGERVSRLVADREKRKAFRRTIRMAAARLMKKDREKQGDVDKNPDSASCEGAGESAKDVAWDLVVDFICFVPHEARDAARALIGVAGIYVLISTDSVYEVCERAKSSDRPRGLEECDDQLRRDVSRSVLRKLDDYGLDKWLCENELKKQRHKALRQTEPEKHGKTKKRSKKASHSDSRSEHASLRFACLRLPDVVGERELPESRHFNLQHRVARGLPLRLTGPQLQSPLSFVYASDVAAAVLAIAKVPEIADGQAFNIGSQETVSLQQYLDLIGTVVDRAPVIKMVPKGSNNTDDFFPSVECGPIDVSKAMRMLPWKPRPLKQWLSATCRWYVEHLADMKTDLDASDSSSDSDSSSSSSDSE